MARTPSRVLVTAVVLEAMARIRVGGGVSVGGGASVPPRTCIAMPSIGVAASASIADSGTESSFASLGMVFVGSAGMGGDALSHR